jgi:hypothetical protein
MEDVVTITQVRAAGLLVHTQAYDCFHVCYFFRCANLDQQRVDSYH